MIKGLSIVIIVLIKERKIQWKTGTQEFLKEQQENFGDDTTNDSQFWAKLAKDGKTWV